MSPDEKQLFNDLIIAAGKLATAADQANVILSEEHESLTAPFVREVRDIIDKCPAAVVRPWDGQLREEDLEEVVSRTGLEPAGSGPVAVKLTHTPTGISRESRSKPSKMENREVALKALRDAVGKEYKSREG